MKIKRARLGFALWQNRYIYLILLPGILHFFVFRYLPIGGLLMAFEQYSARLGLLHSKWVGFGNFMRIFVTPQALGAIRNTIIISLSRLVFVFPVSIMLAILLAEMPGRRVKGLFQTVLTFPHFLSWVVVAVILKMFLSDAGIVNSMIKLLGGEPVAFMASQKLFRGLLYFTENWKEAGWSAIIYIAAISGVDPQLYEAATMDGANRLRRIWHVTLPGISSTIVIMLILAVANMMNSGFEQIFNLRNGAVAEIVDTIDIYVYNITFDAAPNYGFSTAVGLFKAIVNVLMLVIANASAKKITGIGLMQ